MASNSVGGSSPSTTRANSKSGDEIDKRIWCGWYYSPITLPNALEIATKLEFETNKSIREIVDFNYDEICDCFFADVKNCKEEAKLKMRRKLAHGDYVIWERFNKLINSYGGGWNWLDLKLFTMGFERASDDAVTIYIYDKEKFFEKDFVSNIFPVKEGLLKMVRLNVKGKVEISSRMQESGWRGSEVNATFDLMLKYVSSLVKLKCNPPIPIKSLRKVCPDAKLRFCIDIVLEWSDLVESKPIPKFIMMKADTSLVSRLFEAEESKDFTIVAEDGAEIWCHQIVLSMSSPVFQAMLTPENGMKELQERKLVMIGRTRKAVECFVNLLYEKEIPESTLDCELALELLEIGHVYQLTQLWRNMSDLLVAKEKEWFSTDVIIELYYFVMNLDCLVELKKHVLSMLTEMASDEIFSSERFKELEPSEAVKLMGVLYDSSKTK